MTKYLLSIAALLLSGALMAQHVVYPPMKLVNQSSVLFSIDNRPDQLLMSGGRKAEWDFSTLYSPLQYTYSVKSISNDNSMMQIVSAWGTELTLERQRGDYYMSRESHRLSRHLFWEKTYGTPMRYVLPSELMVETKKEHIAEWSSYLSYSELRSLGVSDYDNLYLTVEERAVWSPEGVGLIYLSDGVIEVKQWLKRIYRDIKIVTKKNNVEHAVPNGILERMPSLDLKSFAEEMIFVNSNTKETAAVCTLDELNKVQSILYRTSKTRHDLKVYDNNKKNVFSLYPATSYGQLRFDFSNFRSGKYALIVYNIIGKQMWSKRYDIANDAIIEEDLSFLPKGTYQYTLKDESQNRLLTRRFAIIKP